MSLVALAESDLGEIQEDSATGFGVSIALTDPTGFSATVTGFVADIGLLIDPDTGQAVAGRQVSISVRIGELVENGFTTIPRGAKGEGEDPWLVDYTDINGSTYNFYIYDGMPDRSLGNVTCILGLHNGS